MDQAIRQADFFTLVKEFRLWQELALLSKAERLALISCDFPGLAKLSTRKSHVLNNLATHQQKRLIRKVRSSASSNTENQPFPQETVQIQKLDAIRLVDASPFRIVDGIQALTDQVNELAQGNYALAECTMKHVWALQSWIQFENRKSMPRLRASLQKVRHLTRELQTDTQISEWGFPYAPAEVGCLNSIIPDQLSIVSQQK